MSTSLRRDWLSRPIFRWARRVLPSLSATEREAIEAGDVWWDADLFTGNPDWAKLLQAPPARLSAEELAFLDGPVEELCEMLDDWEITWKLGDLPPEVWEFLKSRKFFAMIIPKAYRGPWLLRLRAFGGHPQALDAFDLGRGHRDGPELAWSGRVAAAVRHQGAAGLLAAAACRRTRDSLLWVDQPGSRIGRRLDG